MPRPDEGLIHAWLDGELEAEEAARVERLVAEDPEWAAAAAEARGLIAASSRILSALDVVAGDVIPQGGRAAPVAPSVAPRRHVPSWMKMAAGVVLVAGLGYVARDGIGFTAAPVASPAAEMIAFPKANESAARETPATPASQGAAEADTPSRDTSLRAAPPAASRSSAALANAAAAGAPSATTAAGSAPVPANVPAPATIPSAEAEAPTSEARARQALADTQALRRRLGDARLEGVVVTGVTAGASADVAAPAGVRALQSQAAKSAASALAPSVAQRADSPRLSIIAGCFRVTTRARLDTLLRDPTILATEADSIKLRIPSADFAWVRRAADGALVGHVWWMRGTVDWRAEPIDCP